MVEPLELEKRAVRVLKNNNHRTFTIPAEGLYPHQWLWDSCFISIGLRHINIPRAKKELVSLLRGQWSNGMLPHMIFDKSLDFNRDRNIWRSNLSLYSPDNVYTSGITQPPMLAEAVYRIGLKMTVTERRSWYKQMLPSLIAYHTWLYEDRDPRSSGLVLQLHPYETGLDSTPPWIDQLHKYHQPWWVKVLELSQLSHAVNLIRRDTRHVPPGQRMNNIDALLYYDVVRQLRDYQYDAHILMNKTKYLLQDVTFNSIFIRANEHLESIAKTVNTDLPNKLTERIQHSRLAFEQLWDNTVSQYQTKNYSTNKLVRVPSIGTLLPLYAGCISEERAATLVKKLHDKHLFATNYPVASVPISSVDFEQHRYWQGPTWLNTNWLIIDGLERYGYTTEAEYIRQKSLELVSTHGFYEYFSPIDGTPAGAKNFSWSAALIIDMLHKSN